MSGLDMSIRRLMTQRACLECAADLAAQLPGPALQLGFGDGSAFDHLREILRRRELIGFFEKLPPLDVALEACGGSHHWGRLLTALVS